MIVLKSAREIDKMREAGRVTARALAQVAAAVRPGITTAELDRIAEEAIRRQGGVPAFKGYEGFPGSVCLSANDVVIHGIPGDQVLHEGDILSVDIGAVVDGYYGDMARTYPVGAIAEVAQRLLTVTWQALGEGIQAARPGGRLGDISAAVQRYVESHGYSVVREFVGHGIGRKMHEDPPVPNYGVAGRGVLLRPGMALAIEPMVNIGGPEVRVLADGWTTVTLDHSLSAHFEDTVVITETGVEILTRVE